MLMTQLSRPRNWLVLLITVTSLRSFALDANTNSNGNATDDPVVQFANAQKPVALGEIIASIRKFKHGFDGNPVGRMMDQRRQLIVRLLNIFRDGTASDDQKCTAAFYLGQMHASEAVDDLATNITMPPVRSDFIQTVMPSIPVALVKIGTPAIPALIQNLQESDDAKVRELSLKVLYTIEGDKDVVQFRLQKTSSVQTDQAKKLRLQAAISSLAGIAPYPMGLDE